MESRPKELNACAALLAEALCNGRSRDEVDELLRFLGVLCALVRSYL